MSWINKLKNYPGNLRHVKDVDRHVLIGISARGFGVKLQDYPGNLGYIEDVNCFITISVTGANRHRCELDLVSKNGRSVSGSLSPEVIGRPRVQLADAGAEATDGGHHLRGGLIAIACVKPPLKGDIR